MINENTTIREFLQVLGTECLREQLNPNIHVFMLFADYKADYSKSETWEIEGISNPIYPNWIITDTRFVNEAEAIKKRGGIVLRVNRDHENACKNIPLHPSETSLDNWEFDYIIENVGDIDELIIKVKEMLECFKLL